MTCSIRYFRQGRREEAGLLIIAKETEFADYRARLEASGYIVSENMFAAPVPTLNNARTEANRTRTVKCVSKVSIRKRTFD